MQTVITFAFYLLFGLTPLVWTSLNFELFEYNKMMFVYALTIIITAAWTMKMIRTKQFILNRTPLDIPILIFLLANLISTVVSISPHTSIWGYYSRSNGGFLSLIAYLLLYYALVSNFGAKDVFKFLKAALIGGIVVSLWAIPEHFGFSPSCLFLTGQADASCWVQDVQARVFATLGQPNWLAAYLAMIIFPTVYFLMTAKSKLTLILYSSFLILYYTAFTFTYSRGATLGLLAGLVVLGGGLLHQLSQQIETKVLKRSLIFLGVFTAVTLLFGSALTDFKLLSKFAPPPRPSITLSGGTQLENGGTESGQIRLIVWKGAWEIFKHYPLFGSGVETYAYSYYQFRPAEHNLVSEWDFLYNKAHNEYLNYLSTTGLVGFLSYVAIILTFIFWAAKRIKDLESSSLILIVLLASYTTYLVQNFVGFSVVVIALLFFLFPALVFLATHSTKPVFLRQPTIHNLLTIILYSRPSYTKLSQVILLTIAATILFTLTKYWLADVAFARGMRAEESGNPGRAYNNILDAVSLNPSEPFYRSELGFAAASSAVAIFEEDATMSAQLAREAEVFTEDVLSQNNKNVSFWRTAIRTYYMLSILDSTFSEKTLAAVDKAISLAPTDAKLPYNKALILNQLGKNDESISALEKTLQLKPNYLEARDKLTEWESDRL